MPTGFTRNYRMHFLFSVALQTQSVQRPNAMMSSPSPMSIIASINQSNFLCSTVPDPQPATSEIIYKEPSNIHQQPTINAALTNTKNSKFKQVVIVQQMPNSDVPEENASDTSNRQTPKEKYIINSQQDIDYKTRSDANIQPPNNRNSYDLKHLVINNHAQGYNNHIIYQCQKSKENEIFDQQDTKPNTYGYEKAKFFLSNFADSNIFISGSSQIYVSDQINEAPSRQSNVEAKNESSESKIVELHSINIQTEESFSMSNLQNLTSKNEENSTSKKKK